MYADMILRNGNVMTMDPQLARAESVAIADGKIAWVGSSKDASSWVGEKTTVIDLQGCYVYPGFIDTHMHVLYTGMEKSYLQLGHCRRKEVLVDSVKEHVNELKANEWLIGVGWDDNGWSEPPNAIDLDAVSQNNPVMLRRCDTHAIWLNSRALKMVRITSQSVSPPGGLIQKDKYGQPTGILIDQAMGVVKEKLPIFSFDQKKDFIQQVLYECLQKGITSVHNAATDDSDFEIFRFLSEKQKLDVRIHLMWAIKDKGEIHNPSLFPQLINDYLHLRTVKLWMDGALGSRGAALYEPYCDDPTNSGLILWDEDELLSVLTSAKEKGFQVAIHAIGDRAAHVVLGAYDEIDVKGLRWRIEHAQQLLFGDINKFAELEVIAAMQPLHATTDMVWLYQRLGEARVNAGSFLLKSLIDSGVVVVGGSDAPVVDLNPLWGMYAAITRSDSHQQPDGGWIPAQKITAEQAIKMYTIDAAYALFREKELGSLTVGKYADLVVLPKDLLVCPIQDYLTMKVLYTIVNGKIVYTNG